MSKQIQPSPPTFWDYVNSLAQAQVLGTVKSRYFPEVWYALENWFQTVKNREVVEVGYGIGLIGEALAKSGWKVTITDSSATALSELKERFAKLQLEGTFVVSDLTKLPFADGSQEAVVAINSLEFVQDPRITIREIQRVLKPSGRAAIVMFNRYGPFGLPMVMQQLRFPPQRPAARLLTKKEFVAVLTTSRLPPAKILERAYYLPISMPGGIRMKLPIAGAYIALVKNNMGRKSKSSKGDHSVLSAKAKSTGEAKRGSKHAKAEKDDAVSDEQPLSDDAGLSD